MNYIVNSISVSRNSTPGDRVTSRQPETVKASNSQDGNVVKQKQQDTFECGCSRSHELLNAAEKLVVKDNVEQSVQVDLSAWPKTRLATGKLYSVHTVIVYVKCRQAKLQ